MVEVSSNENQGSESGCSGWAPGRGCVWWPELITCTGIILACLRHTGRRLVSELNCQWSNSDTSQNIPLLWGLVPIVAIEKNIWTCAGKWVVKNYVQWRGVHIESWGVTVVVFAFDETILGWPLRMDYSAISKKKSNGGFFQRKKASRKV